MRKTPKILIWYRYLRIRTRGLRRVCISIASVAIAAMKVLEWVAKIMSGIPLT